MNIKPKLVLLGSSVAGGLIAAAVVGSLALGTDGPAPSAVSYDHVSSTGVPVASSVMTSEQTSILTGGGATASLNAIRTANGTVFYEAPGEGGGLCFATGNAASGTIGILVCPTHRAAVGQRVAFPSNGAPILDLSPLSEDPSTHAKALLSLSGFAADGIARVGVIDTSGVLHATVVENNTYDLDIGTTPAQASVAYDANGNEVYRKTLTAS